MAKIVRTVRGDIAPEEMGFTTAHEHTLSNMAPLVEAVQEYKAMIPPEMLVWKMENAKFLRDGTALFSDDCQIGNDADWLKAELELFRDRVGGGCLVDASPISLRGDVEKIRQVSEETGVHIIVCTGLYYKDGRTAEYRNLSVQENYDLFRKEIDEGIGGTGIRPGFLKCGFHADPKNGMQLADCEWATLEALSQLSAETGMSLHVHSGPGMSAEQIISIADFALAHGVKPDRLNMMHLDQYVRTPYDINSYIRSMDTAINVDVKLHRTILDKGCFIGFDAWDSTVSILPSNTDRLKALIELLRCGYGGQIVLGHDASTKAYGLTFGNSGFCGFADSCCMQLWNYTDLFDAEDIDKLTYDNPQRLMAF